MCCSQHLYKHFCTSIFNVTISNTVIILHFNITNKGKASPTPFSKRCEVMVSNLKIHYDCWLSSFASTGLFASYPMCSHICRMGLRLVLNKGLFKTTFFWNEYCGLESVNCACALIFHAVVLLYETWLTVNK